MSGKKAAFAEKAIQFLKHKIYRFIDDRGENIAPELQKFVSSMSCRKNRSIGKSPRDI